MVTRIKLDKDTKNKIAKLLTKPLTKTEEFFRRLGMVFERDTDLVF